MSWLYLERIFNTAREWLAWGCKREGSGCEVDSAVDKRCKGTEPKIDISGPHSTAPSKYCKSQGTQEVGLWVGKGGGCSCELLNWALCLQTPDAGVLRQKHLCFRKEEQLFQIFEIVEGRVGRVKIPAALRGLWPGASLQALLECTSSGPCWWQWSPKHCCLLLPHQYQHTFGVTIATWIGSLRLPIQYWEPEGRQVLTL